MAVAVHSVSQQRRRRCPLFLESADMRISEIERRPESGGMKDDVLSTGDRTAAEARSVWDLR